MSMTEQDYRSAAEKETDAKIWQVKEDYSFNMDRIAAALIWEKECREVVARDNQREIARIREEAKDEMRMEFREAILNFDEGCPEGKDRFIRFAGLPARETSYRITITIDCDADIDIHDVCHDIDNRLLDNVDESDKINSQSVDFESTEY